MNNRIFLNADISDVQANEELARCVEDCLDCQDICLQTVRYCLSMSKNYPIGVLLDCIEVCQINADFLLRGSRLLNNISDLCAMACKRSADFCGQFRNDAQMQMCAKACERCAKSCQEIAKLQSNYTLN